jgi:hypothetical protein
MMPGMVMGVGVMSVAAPRMVIVRRLVILGRTQRVRIT